MYLNFIKSIAKEPKLLIANDFGVHE